MRNGWMIAVLSGGIVGMMVAVPRGAWGDDAQEGAIRESVVKISASMRYPDLVRPWAKQSPSEASGTGVVLEGKRILTKCHVVLYASQLFVETSQSGDKRAATVESVSPGMDLAVLKLEDESFFEGRTPLRRTAALPQVKESVLAYGYPQGGSSLSITKGIVSRIEFVPYNEGTSGLRVQVDAAINPGNSGGPALVNDTMVGLIFSKLGASDNIGYIIPSEEIDLFLKDVADGRYDGKPAMYDQLQTLENDALRGFLGVDRKMSGMVVHDPDRDDADYPLKEWDLITKIGDYEIDNVGMVRISDGLRVRFQYLIQKLAENGKVPLSLIRKGEPVAAQLHVSNTNPRLVESLRGRYPSYFVFGPLVFSAVTSDLLSRIERASSSLGPDRQPARDAAGRQAALRRGATGDRRFADVPAPPRRGLLEPVHEGRQGGERRPHQEPPPPGRDAPRLAGESTSRSASTTAPARRSSSTARKSSTPPTRSSPTTASASRRPTTCAVRCGKGGSEQWVQSKIPES